MSNASSQLAYWQGLQNAQAESPLSQLRQQEEIIRKMMGMYGGALPIPQEALAIDAAKVEALRKAEPRKVGRRIADGVTPITAWRAWACQSSGGELRLKALGQSEIWEPKAKIEAKCIKTTLQSHPAPHNSCECGVWAFSSLDELMPALSGYTVQVFGQVSLWGRIIETTKGFRAQYAYPKELWLLDESLEQLGYIYGVPIRTASGEQSKGSDKP